MASSFAWGIDVGNRALKAIKLVRDGDGFRIDEFEVIEHETVLSDAGDNRDHLIQTALANFVQRHPSRGGDCAISVSGQASFARFIKLPPVEKKKIPEIVRFEAIQQIPFPLADVEWSYQLFEQPDSPDVEVGIFAMRRELIDHQIQFYRDVELDVTCVQMNPLAVYNAMYFDNRIKGTTMIMDLGAENTDLIIAEGETIWLRSVPIGGNSFTEALGKQFKLNFQKAEELKRNAPTSKYARQIFQAMRPVFADIVAEIQRSIGFYASVHRESRIKRIIALGGTFRLPGLQKYLQQNLQMEVERVDGFTSGAPIDGKAATVFNENILSLVTAYGLAVQAMGRGKIDSSLLPMHIRREKMWRDKTKYFAGAAALFCIGTGIAIGQYYLQEFQYKTHEDDRHLIDTTLASAKQLDSAWSSIETSGGTDLTRINNVRSLLGYRDLWPSIISDIRSCLPVPQKEVLSGDVDKIKSIPRAKREQILIDTMKCDYTPNLAGALAPPGSPPPDASATPDANAQRGFVITLTCTTPNAKKYDFVTPTFIANLQKLGPNNAQQVAKGYAIQQAIIQSASELGQDPTRVGMLQSQYREQLQLAIANGTAGAAGSSPTPNRSLLAPPGVSEASGPVLPQDDPALDDPVTGETMIYDEEFTIQIVVVLDPPPPPATAAAGASADAK